ncbi:PrpR N-terminal domain-containing protein [Paenibacillus cisolokensis]|uniref:PrpR N-terminal domain-containing protein n=1 Tax=Paenibacillus cisolokensis TaxID=1658519 RepID=UPI003D2869D4
MGIKTLVVAPYRGLAELIAGLKPELQGFDITVVQGDLEEAEAILRRYESEGFEWIVSRGGTARLLRRRTALPVTEIPVSGIDIMRLLTLLKDYPAPYEMIGFPNIIESVAAVSGLMNIPFPHTAIERESEVTEALRAAKRKGAAVIVGDTVAVRLAKEEGLQGILITSGRESVIEAFRQVGQMYAYLERYERQIRTARRVIDGMDSGLAVLDGAGTIQYANESFFRLMRLSHAEVQDRSLFDLIPALGHYMRDIGGDEAAGARPALEDPGRKIMIDGKTVATESGETMYSLEIRHFTPNKLRVRYHGQAAGVFSQFVVIGADFREKVELAVRCLKSGLPAAVHGERGTGKRFFASAVQDALGNPEGLLVEAAIAYDDNWTFERLVRFMRQARPESVLYVRGAEQLPPELQRKLAGLHAEVPARIIYSFEKDPKKMRDESRMDAVWYEALAGCVIRMPPLRETMDRLEEYVRTFLVKYNERYGKQIVGVRPAVWDELKARRWDGNIRELENAIRKSVKRAEGPYIEEAATGEPQSEEPEQSVPVSGRPVLDLSQTLDRIEQDVIRIVLEEENMNQSKAAKRLGINRSTLWRKIREIEENR